MSNPSSQSSRHATVDKGLLKIISWNIHDAMDSTEGPKSEIDEFAENISSSSIFCLQETKR